MQQKVERALGGGWTKQRHVEVHLQAAWNAIGGAMTVEEFSAAAFEAAAAIGLRSRLANRIATGEIKTRSHAS
jgi:hypothetical protein